MIIARAENTRNCHEKIWPHSAVHRAAPKATDPEILSELANSLASVIEETTELLIAGKPVRVIEVDDRLTNQEAAELLNVSRLHLVKLLESGAIPQLPKVGRHRRVSRIAVLRYKRIQDAKPESALKALAAISQRRGLGY